MRPPADRSRPRSTRVHTLSPVLLSLDWLTLSMRGPWWQFPVEADPWELKHVGTLSHPAYVVPTDLRTRMWGRIFYITDHLGEKLVTVCCAPHHLNHGGDWMTVQFANSTLPSGEWVNLFKLLRMMGCEHLGIVRVDIAADGVEGDGGGFQEVIQESWSTDVRYYGKGDWLARHTRGKITGADFGDRAGNKFLRVYCKTREMKRKGQKRHIQRAWAQALSGDANAFTQLPVMNRLEVQLKGKEVRRYFPKEGNADYIESLATTPSLLKMFASTVPTLFDFRTVAERARDATSIVQWDWTRVYSGGVTLGNRAPRTWEMSEHGVKTSIRAIWMLAHITSDLDAFAYAEKTANAWGNGLPEWYKRKRAEWFRQHSYAVNSGDVRTLAFFKALATGTQHERVEGADADPFNLD